MPKLDKSEAYFFEKELNHVKARAYQKKYPMLKATALFPVSFEASDADETISYTMYSEVGVAKIISNYADDLPAVDVKGEEFFNKIRGLGDHYHYNIQEIKKAAKTGKPLKQSKANAARKAVDTLINNIAWQGDAKYELVGFLTHPNIPVDISTKKIDNTSTPAEILELLNNAVIDTFELTNGVEIPNTMVMPLRQYSYIQRTKVSVYNSNSILTEFLIDNPSITKVEWTIELKDVTPAPSGAAGPVDVLITYDYDEDKISLEIPQPFTQEDPEKQNLSYKVDCHARCGGMIIVYPLSCRIVEDV